MLILLLIGVLAAYLLQKYLYRRGWYKNLTVSVAFEEPFVYEGDTSELKEVLVNDKLLPLPSLEVRIAMDRNLHFLKEASKNTNITDQTYKRDIFSFLSRQQITRRLTFEAKKRGYYRIDTSDVICSNLLLSEYYQLEMPQQTALYVYPGQVDTSRIRLVCSALSGMILAHNRVYQDPFEFSGIREYRKEDPMNRINWKASARNQQLMVNQYDATTSIDVTILMDLEDRTILKHENLVEESIRIASSLAAHLVKGRMDFALKANVKDAVTGEPFCMEFQGAGAYLGALNQHLALLDPEQITAEPPVFLQKEAENKKSGQTYVVISKNLCPEVLDALALLRGSDNRILFVIPQNPYDKPEEFSLCGVTPVFWEVSAS